MHADDRVVNDQQRIFAARIVRSQHDDVARASGRLSHQRTLGAVPVAAATEQRDDAARGIEFLRGGQQVAQRIIGVRVIHNHQKRLAQIDALEAARHGGKLRNSRGDDFARKVQRHARADGGENIVNVDSPHQMRVDFDFSRWGFGRAFDAGKRKRGFARGDVRSGFQAVGQRPRGQTGQAAYRTHRPD